MATNFNKYRKVYPNIITINNGHFSEQMQYVNVGRRLHTESFK